MAQIFKGIWPALVTPINGHNEVNVPALRQLVDYLIDKGVNGFYVGGSTGGGIFMPVAQRKLLAETVLDHVRERVPIIIHVGTVCCEDAIELSQHAYEHGADGVSSIIPPLYNSLESLYQYYRTIAGSVPEMPLLAYLLNPEIDSLALMRRLIDIPNLAGVKYTGSNMYEFRQIIDLGQGQWTTFSGMDEQAIYGCMMGATGCVGSTINLMPGVYLQILQAVQTGKYAKAQELQVQANHVTAVMVEIGFKGALKALLSDLLGIDIGQPRLPDLPLTDSQYWELKEKLAETDFDMLTKL